MIYANLRKRTVGADLRVRPSISLCKSMDGMTHRSFPTVQSPNILKPANYFSITQTTVFMNSSFKIGAFAKGARNFRKGTSA